MIYLFLKYTVPYFGAIILNNYVFLPQLLVLINIYIYVHICVCKVLVGQPGNP